ncbi:MAG: hypothetical protein Q8K63_13780 [Acidimicrobiales bacterium]|nr:hypothetical protein [Acidimicrobiales bacterium]
MRKSKHGVKTGYTPQETREQERQREANARRGRALQAFMARYDAVPILERQASDWLEGFGVGATGSGGSGNAMGGGRTLADAIRGMVDHKLDPETNQIITTSIPQREGHELALRCTEHAERIRAWLNEAPQLDKRLYELLPKDHPLAEMQARHAERTDAGAGTCDGCGRPVPGIRENPTLGIKADRIKAGYCYGQPDACYPKWLAAGSPSKAEFKAITDPGLGKDETPGNPPPTNTTAILSDFTGHQSAHPPPTEPPSQAAS